MNSGHLFGEGRQYPTWVPDTARIYLCHVEGGTPIREIARRRGRHASTVLRQIRRFENRRDDPLVDEALAQLGGALEDCMRGDHTLDDETLKREAHRVLRRLSESGAVLAVAGELEKAVVVRELPDGRSVRTAVIDRSAARAMALREWISCEDPKARIVRYAITAAGRAELKRLAGEALDGDGFDAEPGERDGPREWGTRAVTEDGERRLMRVNVAESPLAVLARRRDPDGRPFLTSELIGAGERLREDFELAQMGPRTTQNWEHFMVAGTVGGAARDGGPGEGPAAARRRVQGALADLGPGLGDVALRVCCFLEGLEQTERRMGWSARSGKIVLRIALQRLALHYERVHGRYAPKIG